MIRFENGIIFETMSEALEDFYADGIIVPNDTSLAHDSDLIRRLTKKAGKSTLDSARSRAPIPLGEAVVTAGGGLLSTFMIHVALFSADNGISGGEEDKKSLLKSAVKNALLRSSEVELESIGMPDLGGYLGFSLQESARLILAALVETVLPHRKGLKKVFCLLKNEEESRIFAQIASAISV
jgi:O-acetyl-ADP-ribose deacetylase (regulator of RNase III)